MLGANEGAAGTLKPTSCPSTFRQLCKMRHRVLSWEKGWRAWRRQRQRKGSGAPAAWRRREAGGARERRSDWCPSWGARLDVGHGRLFIAELEAVRRGKIFRPGRFLPAMVAGHSEVRDYGDPSHRKSAASHRQCSSCVRGGRGGVVEGTRRQRRGGGWLAAAVTCAQRVSGGDDVCTVRR